MIGDELHQQYRSRLLALLARLSYEQREVTLASGLKSNFYIDCKQTVLTAEGHFLVGSLFEPDPGEQAPEVEAIGGLTMGADPLASAVSTMSYLAGRPLRGVLRAQGAEGARHRPVARGHQVAAAGDAGRDPRGRGDDRRLGAEGDRAGARVRPQGQRDARPGRSRRGRARGAGAGGAARHAVPPAGLSYERGSPRTVDARVRRRGAGAVGRPAIGGDAGRSAPKPIIVDFSETPREYRRRDYDDVYERWTRHEVVRVRSSTTRWRVWVTFKAWDFREAYVEHYAGDLQPVRDRQGGAARSTARELARRLRVPCDRAELQLQVERSREAQLGMARDAGRRGRARARRPSPCAWRSCPTLRDRVLPREGPVHAQLRDPFREARGRRRRRTSSARAPAASRSGSPAPSAASS